MSKSTILPLALLLLTFCAPLPPRIPCSSCDDPDRFVYLSPCNQASDELFPIPFRHPFRLTAEEWQTILNSLRMQSRPSRLLFPVTDGPVVSAFFPEEVAYLRDALPSAFSQASPNHCVIFGLKRLINSSLWEVTTGLWFTGDSELYTVLYNYREKTTVPGIWEDLKRNPLRSTGGVFYDFIPNDYQTVREKGGRVRRSLKKDILEIVVHYKALLNASGWSAGNHNSESIPRSIQEHLRTLKRLYDEGLIPDKEYRMKVKELLAPF